MRKILKLYLPFTSAVLQTNVTYRISFFFNMVGRTLRVIVTLYLWYAIYKSSGKINLSGFTVNEILLYIIFGDLIANTVMSATCLETIPNEVRSGSISMSLLKPINYHAQILFSSLGNVINTLLFYVIPFFILSVWWFSVYGGFNAPGILYWIFFIIACITGFFIYFFLTFTIATISFFTTSIWGLSIIMFAIVNFLSGRMIPMDFFPPKVMNIINYLPFSSIIYTPVMILMNKLTIKVVIEKIAIQIIWVFILGTVSGLLWKKAINKLTIGGG